MQSLGPSRRVVRPVSQREAPAAPARQAAPPAQVAARPAASDGFDARPVRGLDVDFQRMSDDALRLHAFLLGTSWTGR